MSQRRGVSFQTPLHTSLVILPSVKERCGKLGRGKREEGREVDMHPTVLGFWCECPTWSCIMRKFETCWAETRMSDWR